MRLADNYAYANPFLEPISLDALAVRDADDAEALVHTIADPAPDGEELVERAEARSAIHRFLGTLRPRDREVVQRIFWNDESQADVARVLRVSGAAISKRMSRIAERGRDALAMLRESVLLQ